MNNKISNSVCAFKNNLLVRAKIITTHSGQYTKMAQKEVRRIVSFSFPKQKQIAFICILQITNAFYSHIYGEPSGSSLVSKNVYVNK